MGKLRTDFPIPRQIVDQSSWVDLFLQIYPYIFIHITIVKMAYFAEIYIIIQTLFQYFFILFWNVCNTFKFTSCDNTKDFARIHSGHLVLWNDIPTAKFTTKLNPFLAPVRANQHASETTIDEIFDWLTSFHVALCAYTNAVIINENITFLC